MHSAKEVIYNELKEQEIRGQLNILEVLEWLNTPLILIKSPVGIGSTDNLKQLTNKRIVYSPEFFSDKQWCNNETDKDIINKDFFIFGGDKQDTSEIVDAYMNIAGPCKKYIQISAIDAEMSKYVANAFISTKSIFSYEMKNICKSVGADWNIVRSSWLSDLRMGEHFTSTVNFGTSPLDEEVLFKDLINLEAACFYVGYYCDLINEIIDSNIRIEDEIVEDLKNGR
jgi:UDP-glucose 6-dehydrogenase